MFNGMEPERIAETTPKAPRRGERSESNQHWRSSPAPEVVLVRPQRPAGVTARGTYGEK